MAKRIRSVWPESQLCHLWAHGLAPDRYIKNATGNVFARGDTIYSYGHHFPISRRVIRPDGERLAGSSVRVGKGGHLSPGSVTVPAERAVFLFTTRTYSNTTRGHCYTVRGAIRNLGPAFDIDPTDAAGRDLWRPLAERKGSAKPVAEWYQTRIDAEEKAAAAPRILARTREAHIKEANTIYGEWRELHAAFALRVSINSVTAPTTVADVRAKYAPQFAKQAEADKRAAAKRVQAEAEALRVVGERAEYALTLIPAWRAGDDSRGVPDAKGYTVSIRDVPYPVLRLTNDDGTDVVQTSHGASVPVEDARRALDILPRLLARIDTDPTEPAAMVGNFRGMSVSPNALRIGCHTIPWAEVAAFCGYAGWVCPALPTAELAAAQ